MNFDEQVPLAQYTTFNIGGVARYFAHVEKRKDLGVALDYAQTRKLPHIILAGGSNMLVSDEGFEGLVIKISFSKVTISHRGSVTAEAGVALMPFIMDMCSQGLSGLEHMYGIPGSVGGAVRGNAGAFGTEITDVVTSVTALNIETREERIFSHEECRFGYRTSFFKNNSEWVILDATFLLTEGDAQECIKNAENTLAERNKRQIQDIKSAGSFFMNPVVPESIQAQFEKEKGTPARERRVPAGWLIEKSGFKGACQGEACTGERSANYVINKGSAVSADVRVLTKTIQEKILEEFGVELKEEVTLVGTV